MKYVKGEINFGGMSAIPIESLSAEEFKKYDINPMGTKNLFCFVVDDKKRTEIVGILDKLGDVNVIDYNGRLCIEDSEDIGFDVSSIIRAIIRSE